MRRAFFLLNLLFLSAFCFAQQNSNLRVIGSIPGAEDNRMYQIQVGAFRIFQNAERAFERLNNASFNPEYEIYFDLTRVVINGVAARDVPSCLQRINNAGFTEVIIRIDTGRRAAAQTPPALSETGNRTAGEGETLNPADITKDGDVSAISTDSTGSAAGENIAGAFIETNDDDNISAVVVPQENYYAVPESQIASLPQESYTGDFLIQDITEYRSEPAFRLSYRFNNKGESRGASGINGGIDIIARGENNQWLWTTFFQSGWFYDLNGVKREMENGFQKDADNGVELTIKPEFINDRGVQYLQLTHRLYNPNSFPVSGQKFGASADVMINKNDGASLIHTPFGVRMTDSENNPSVELLFICERGNGITPVDTLWLGTYDNGRHLDYIYADRRADVHGEDSAVGFSYQNIDLASGEAKEFVVRFNLAGNED